MDSFNANCNLLCLVVWSYINPTQNLALLITVGLIIAIASATQDITVDALRIEQINEHEGKSMAAGAAMAVVGWWTGYKLGGVIALFTAEYFEKAGITDYWQATFLVLSIVIILMNIGLMFVHEPSETDRQSKQSENDKMIESKLGSSNIITSFIAWITGTIGGPIISFFKKNGFAIAVGILGFVFLFKIGEAFLGRMSIVFYKELGFSKGQIAIYSKTLGWDNNSCVYIVRRNICNESRNYKNNVCCRNINGFNKSTFCCFILGRQIRMVICCCSYT